MSQLDMWPGMFWIINVYILGLRSNRLLYNILFAFKQWQSEASNYWKKLKAGVCCRPIVCIWIVTTLTPLFLLLLLLFIHWHLIHRGRALRWRNEIWAHSPAQLGSSNCNYSCFSFHDIVLTDIYFLWNDLPETWHRWQSFSSTVWRVIVWKTFPLKILNKIKSFFQNIFIILSYIILKTFLVKVKIITEKAQAVKHI